VFAIEEFKNHLSEIRKADIEKVSRMRLKGEKITVKCRDCDIDVYHYKPDRTGNAPVMFDLHGGGFVFGHAASQDAFCDRVRKILNIHVITVNYRLAPEFPYPAAVNDVYDVLKYFYENSEKYGIDKDNMAVCGHSAGGNLAAVAALKANKTGEFKLKCQILDYPFVDAVTSPYDKPAFKEAIPPNRCAMFDELYSKPEERSSPFISPLYADINDMKGLPPAAVITAELDSLREEGEKYVSRLIKAGVPVYARRFLGAVHAFVELGSNREGLKNMPPEMVANLPENLEEMADEGIEFITDALRLYLKE
jgi:acetyl esterase